MTVLFELWCKSNVLDIFLHLVQVYVNVLSGLTLNYENWLAQQTFFFISVLT